MNTQVLKENMNNKKIIFVLAMVLGQPLMGHSEELIAQNQSAPRARMGETNEQKSYHQMVDVSAEVYNSLSKGKHGEVPEAVLRKSRCIAVLPNVMTGAIVVGGTHGKGLASCRLDNNSWTQPVAISLNQGSIGLQAGAKSADLVLFFQNEQAVSSLKKGKLALGSDISAVAGNFDSNVDQSTAGVVVYTRTQGLFAGASVNGGILGKDQTNMTNYYGKKVDYLAMLEGRESPDASYYSQKLTKLYPLN
jgi:lipid-binding SYLF domain-containing protein